MVMSMGRTIECPGEQRWSGGRSLLPQVTETKFIPPGLRLEMAARGTDYAMVWNQQRALARGSASGDPPLLAQEREIYLPNFRSGSGCCLGWRRDDAQWKCSPGLSCLWVSSHPGTAESWTEGGGSSPW